MHTTAFVCRLAGCLALVAVAGAGLVGSTPQRTSSSTAAYSTASSGAVAASARTVTVPAPTSGPTARETSSAAAAPRTSQATQLCLFAPDCCPIQPPPPRVAAAGSPAAVCGIDVPHGVSDPTGLDTFDYESCAAASDVAVGSQCATATSSLGVAASEGSATAGELALSTGGTAYACGGPVPVAASGGSSHSCHGTVPTGVGTGAISVNGG